MWPSGDWQQGKDCLLLLPTFNRYFLNKNHKYPKVVMCFIELKYEEGKGWGIVVWWGLWGGRLSCPPHLLGGSWDGGAPHSRLGD